MSQSDLSYCIKSHGAILSFEDMYERWTYDSVKIFIMGFVKVIESIIYRLPKLWWEISKVHICDIPSKSHSWMINNSVIQSDLNHWGCDRLSFSFSWKNIINRHGWVFKVIRAIEDATDYPFPFFKNYSKYV